MLRLSQIRFYSSPLALAIKYRGYTNFRPPSLLFAWLTRTQ